MATRLPFITPIHIKMRAMPRKAPAIVQRPDHLYVTFFQIPKQRRQMNAVTVQIMEMHDIGRKALQFSDQLLGAKIGELPVSAQQLSEIIVNHIFIKGAVII